MVSPSSVDSLVLNITVTWRAHFRVAPPLPHVSDDSFSFLDPSPSVILGFCLFLGYSLLDGA